MSETPQPAGRDTTGRGLSRRDFVNASLLSFLAGLTGCSLPRDDAYTLESFVQDNFRRMSEDELKAVLQRMERNYSAEYGKPVSVAADPPLPNTKFAMALDLSRCVGCRRCAYACVQENNQSRDPQIQWIKVFEMDKPEGKDFNEVDFENGKMDYEAEEVPREGKFYFPIACQQCEDSFCEKVCPVGATWKEPDGIVVIDYNWCIGCRYCIAACPYQARRFNWAAPNLPADEMNPQTHYLGNRPRPKGVVEKCTFCIHRVRKGLDPRCVEICPTGARAFGNLLDPESAIRRILDTKPVYVVKKHLNTQPKFFYYFS